MEEHFGQVYYYSSESYSQAILNFFYKSSFVSYPSIRLPFEGVSSTEKFHITSLDEERLNISRVAAMSESFRKK